MKNKNDIKELRQVYSLLGNKKISYFITIMVTCLAYPSMNILFSFAYKRAVNAIEFSEYKLFLFSCLFFLIAVFVQCILEPFSNYRNAVIVNKTVFDIRCKVYQYMTKLPLSYFEKNDSGDTILRLSSNIDAFEPIFRGYFRDLMTAVIWGIGALVSMLFINYKMAACAVALSMMAYIANKLYTGVLKDLNNEMQEEVSDLNQNFGMVQKAAYLAKIYGKTLLLSKQFDEANKKLKSTLIKTANKQIERDMVTEVINGITNVGLLILGLYLVRLKQTDIGSIVAIISLQSGLTFMFKSLGGFLANMQGGLANARRVFALLEQKEEPERYNVEKAGCESKDAVIVIEHLSFSYDQKNYVLTDVNLKVNQNEFVAIVGLNGSGKSTLIKTLLGFYEPEGKISLCNCSFGDYSLSEVREKIAYVPQIPVLFNTSIRENILFGKPDATEDEFINAAKMANVYEFVQNLEAGFDTIIGENGVFLSGGQKQRIAIARALIKNAEILLLDEATSALDTINEAEVMETIRQIIGKRTVLMITHHLNTIQDAAQILFMESGRIIEQGTHNSLMEQKGAYEKLYNLQMTSADYDSIEGQAFKEN